MKFLKAALFSLLICIAPFPVSAASVNDDMKDALHALVLTQNLDIYWPIIARNAAINGAAEVERGALAVLDAKSGVTGAEREKYKFLVKEMSSEVAAEINQLHKNLDISQLVEDMVSTVYPKYYDVAEIRELASFYSSKAFQKMVVAELKIAAESKRPGANVPDIRNQAYASFSPEEARRAIAFSSSGIARKQQRIAETVNAECMAFLESRTHPAFEEVTRRYARILVERLRSAE